MLPTAANPTMFRAVLPAMRWSLRRYCQKIKADGRQIEWSSENKDDKSFFQSIFERLSPTADTIAFLNQKNAFTFDGFVSRAKASQEAMAVKSQEFKEQRHKILGPNLATAHFLVNRGASVRFVDSSTWIRKEHVHKLPAKFVPNLYLEEIDASNMDLLYEGFENLIKLYYLKSLILRNCEHVDDWCLDRLHIFHDSPLEHLDVSFCSRITERGLCSLHKLRKLKTLVVEELPNVRHKELIYMMIEDYIPGVKIIDSKRQNMLI